MEEIVKEREVSFQSDCGGLVFVFRDEVWVCIRSYQELLEAPRAISGYHSHPRIQNHPP